MHVIYTANARIPSEKAHAYQILQMCEAFVQAGAEVRLLHARRKNPPALQKDDIWGFYGLARTFERDLVQCLDIYPFGERLPARLRMPWSQLAAPLQTATYNAALALRLARRDWSQAIVYSRDPFTLILLAALWPRRARRLFLETHAFPSSRIGQALQRWLVKRLGGVIVITEHLMARYAELGTPAERLLIARDGYRAARFVLDGDQKSWRERLGWPRDAFIVGFMGRFHTMGMAKGLVELTDAVASLAKDRKERLIRLALIGGPGETVDELRARLAARALPPETILYPGQVPAGEVPGYLCALDLCVQPFPWTTHFAYYASPMKLFEYMASGRPIVATDLPATAEVIQHERNGLLTPPGDDGALAGALRRLRDDPELGMRLARQAAADVLAYTWEARAQRILEFVERAQIGLREGETNGHG